MKHLLYIIITSFLFAVLNFGQLIVKDQEGTPNTLLQLNDEGIAGSITFPNVGTKLAGQKLYNYDDNLYWGGYKLGLAQTAGGWTDIGSVIHTTISTAKVGIGTNSTNTLHNLSIHENSSSYNYLRFTNETTTAESNNGVLVGLDPGEDFRIHSYEENNIKFFTNDLEKMRINNEGFIGIGNTNPATEIDVQDGADVDSDCNLRLRSVGTNNDGIIEFYENSTAPAMSIHYDGGTNELNLVDLTQTIPVNRVNFKRDGDVGIGTENPDAKLDVNGDLKISGAYKGNISSTSSSDGAPFPRPAYNSGWIPMVVGRGLILTHDIGGNVDNYVVDMQFRSGLVINIIGYGIDRMGDPSPYNEFGAYWSRLTTESITVQNGATDSMDIRVRIWVYN